MDAGDLRGGFRLGEWLVEPRASRITGESGAHGLTQAQLELLLLLAARHGEAVSRRDLRESLFPGQPGADVLLRDTVRSLRELLGGSVKDRRYVVGVDHGGLALVAHLELLQGVSPLPGTADPPRLPAGPTAAMIGSLHTLLVELRRRSVLKVVGAYLVAMWLVLQIAETTFEPLHLPGWWMTVLTILAVVGLPIVAVLAWSYEITPGGIVLDGDGPNWIRLPKARRSVAPALVAGATLMAAVTGVAWWRTIDVPEAGTAAPDGGGRPSIAVLPLADMSAAGNSSYLGDGLSEELSARLAQIPGLRVAARTSAFEFKDRSVDVRRIGEALGVRHVLEGSVRRDGEKVRVSVQLIDATNGYQVWAGTYDRAWRDVIAMQDDIARSVTDALRVVLGPTGQSGGAAARAPDARAFDPYLAGLALLRQSGDMSRLKEAEERFGEAVAIDPSFARAHAGLCEVGVRIHGRTKDPADLARAEASCRRALDLDPTLVETEKGLGALYVASGRPSEAQAIYRALVARNPQDADGHIGLGRSQQAAGLFDLAEASLRAAVRAEPTYWGGYSALGVYLLERGKFTEAVDPLREVTELTPSSANAYSNFGIALLMSGDLPGAAEAYRRSLAIEPSRGGYANLGNVHYFLHEFEEAAANYERATALATHDQSLWGNLGDAVWQLPGRRGEAVGYYRRAIALGLRELESNPDDVILIAQLGYYHGRTGEPGESRRYLDRAAATAIEDQYAFYYAAVAAADRGDLDSAREFAARAMRLGYPGTLLRADPSLANVNQDVTKEG